MPVYHQRLIIKIFYYYITHFRETSYDISFYFLKIKLSQFFKKLSFKYYQILIINIKLILKIWKFVWSETRNYKFM